MQNPVSAPRRCRRHRRAICRMLHGRFHVQRARQDAQPRGLSCRRRLPHGFDRSGPDRHGANAAGHARVTVAQLLPGCGTARRSFDLRAQYARPRAATVLCEPHGLLRAEVSGREFDANALSPRAALRRVLARLTQAGLRATVAPELEFYLVNRHSEDRPHELVAARPRPGSPVREMACEPDSVERAGHFAPYFDELVGGLRGTGHPDDRLRA
jgi:hypothetical protein